MSIRTDHEKEFISLFNSIARGTRRLQVFTDFISCSVIAIQNGLQFCEKREQKVSVSSRPSSISARVSYHGHFREHGHYRGQKHALH